MPKALGVWFPEVLLDPKTDIGGQAFPTRRPRLMLRTTKGEEGIPGISTRENRGHIKTNGNMSHVRGMETRMPFLKGDSLLTCVCAKRSQEQRPIWRGAPIWNSEIKPKGQSQMARLLSRYNAPRPVAPQANQLM